MSTRDEIVVTIRRLDSRNLMEAARIIRRLKIDFPGASRAGVIRTLERVAGELQPVDQEGRDA